MQAVMINYTTTEERNPAQKSKKGKQCLYFHSLASQCPSLILGGKGLQQSWKPSVFAFPAMLTACSWKETADSYGFYWVFVWFFSGGFF